MGLVDQKNIVTFYVFSKKSFQVNIWIKYIIIIADDSIHPDGKIQRHLKWTDSIFFCLSKNRLPVKILCFCPQFIYGIIYSVIVSFCIRTFLWITVHLITKTQLFFCRDRDRLEMQAILPKNCKCIFCHRPRDRSCRQIKKRFSFSVFHRTDCRKNC